MKYPQILDLIIENVKSSERRVRLEASIARGLTKDMRNIAIILTVSAIVLLLTGVGTVVDQKDEDRKEALLKDHGVTVTATINEKTGTVGVCESYQFDYEGKHYNFAFDGRRSCSLRDAKAGSATLRILPEDPSVHVFEDCQPKRKNGYITIFLAVGMFGFVGLLLFKRGLSFDQILERRRHRFARACSP